MDEETKAAYRKALVVMAANKLEAEENRAWASAHCSHLQPMVFEHNGVSQWVCRHCGCRRTVRVTSSEVSDEN